MRKLLYSTVMIPLLVCSVPAMGQEPREAGFNELIVVDPGVEEKGLPTVIVKDGKVEIPPTLHVHPYYYCGDKEYQAQILNGGPTIIVANHPKTGKKLYIDAVLPQGAPIVSYTAFSITYTYSDRRVCIEFSPLFHDKAMVKYVSGRGVARDANEQIAEIKDSITDHSQKSRLMTELGEFKNEATQISKGAIGFASQTGAVIVERSRAATRLIPGIAALRSAGMQAEERGAVEEVRQAGIRRLRDEVPSIPTNQ